MTEYALALSDDELDRYRGMAERAREGEEDLWALAGVREGAIVADIGCGPGAVSALLAALVGPRGRVDSGELQFKLFVTPFCAVGRRPE